MCDVSTTGKHVMFTENYTCKTKFQRLVNFTAMIYCQNNSWFRQLCVSPFHRSKYHRGRCTRSLLGGFSRFYRIEMAHFTPNVDLRSGTRVWVDGVSAYRRGIMLIHHQRITSLTWFFWISLNIVMLLIQFNVSFQNFIHLFFNMHIQIRIIPTCAARTPSRQSV